MNLSQISMISLFSIGMGLGQLLLKYSAKRQSNTLDATLIQKLISLFSDWPYLLGVALYASLLIYWVWLLTFIPLSRAYPFTLISLIVVAIGSALLFQEVLTIQFILGLTIIGIGLAVLSTG